MRPALYKVEVFSSGAEQGPFAVPGVWSLLIGFMFCKNFSDWFIPAGARGTCDFIGVLFLMIGCMFCKNSLIGSRWKAHEGPVLSLVYGVS
jgi:hypothetical protein